MDIDWSKVTKIYYGKDNHCRCGCGGTYHEPGSKGFTRCKNAIEKITVEPDKDSNYINWSLENNKAYTIYFN